MAQQLLQWTALDTRWDRWCSIRLIALGFNLKLIPACMTGPEKCLLLDLAQ